MHQDAHNPAALGVAFMVCLLTGLLTGDLHCVHARGLSTTHANGRVDIGLNLAS